jgi:site-specific DNA-methyltransferase (adenine-specific)
VADERGSQTWGGWAVCDGCGKPIITEGLGTALKPATEPICLARKPLSEKTVAANVLKWGTGALNIDGTRIDAPEGKTSGGRGQSNGAVGWQPFENYDDTKGRWPANLLHDGSDEVLAGFPETGAASGAERVNKAKTQFGFGDGKDEGHISTGPADNGGSAARFFYSAKAGPLDRIGSAHPTVKPVDVMRWLCRLITPPGGLILEPFAGSGTTGIAAMAEGFDCQMIDIEADHVADIERKLAYLRGEGASRFAEHNHAKAKRQKPAPLGGLFGDHDAPPPKRGAGRMIYGKFADQLDR